MVKLAQRATMRSAVLQCPKDVPSVHGVQQFKMIADVRKSMAVISRSHGPRQDFLSSAFYIDSKIGMHLLDALTHGSTMLIKRNLADLFEAAGISANRF